MRRRGIQTAPINRLQRAIGLTERVNAELLAGKKLSDYSNTELARMAECWRTMWEAFVVGHAISQRRASTKAITDDLLQAFLKGADVPGDSQIRGRATLSL